jgi:arylsulfatase A-like enzyme
MPELAQTGVGDLNVVLVLIDSVNWRDLRAYGGDTAETPNIDRLARRSCRFDKHYVGSLPCMPARRELFSGFKELFWRPWGPLEQFDRRLPRLVEGAGYSTAIVTDHYHYWEESANGYVQAFQQAEFIRGHEHDNWRVPACDADLPAWVDNIERWRPGEGRRYYANVRDFRHEEDFFPAKVMSRAAAWLGEPHPRPFFLQIESFDVHEPFHLVEPYASMYGDPSGYDRFTVWPPYQDPARQREFMASATAEELAFIRSQYLGKLTMVDRWLGEVLDVLDRRDLWDNTVVILTSDHGHDLGERGVFGKSYPHYDSHARIPLFIWDPRHPDATSVGELTSTVDLFSTVLDVCGVESSAIHGRSLGPLVAGTGARSATSHLYGTFGQGVCCTDGRFTLFKSPVDDRPLYSYSSLYYKPLVSADLLQPEDAGRFIPGVDAPQWRVPIRMAPLCHEDFLFDLQEDPGQTRNLWSSAPAERERMLELLLDHMRREGAPPEQYGRLGLPAG